jgi:ribosome recycling factor
MLELEEKMKKTIEVTKNRLATIRTGRANPELLTRIQVEYYGALVPINQVANVSVSEKSTLLINVFDKGAVQNVEKAIMKSDLGLNPQTDGSIIRLKLPDLTEERRKGLVKIVKQQAEEGKVSLRNIRREYLDGLKKEEGQSEDHIKANQEKAQKIIDNYTNIVDEIANEKEVEIMQV